MAPPPNSLFPKVYVVWEGEIREQPPPPPPPPPPKLVSSDFVSVVGGGNDLPVGTRNGGKNWWHCVFSTNTGTAKFPCLRVCECVCVDGRAQLRGGCDGDGDGDDGDDDDGVDDFPLALELTILCCCCCCCCCCCYCCAQLRRIDSRRMLIGRFCSACPNSVTLKEEGQLPPPPPLLARGDRGGRDGGGGGGDFGGDIVRRKGGEEKFA